MLHYVGEIWFSCNLWCQTFHIQLCNFRCWGIIETGKEDIGYCIPEIFIHSSVSRTQQGGGHLLDSILPGELIIHEVQTETAAGQFWCWVQESRGQPVPTRNALVSHLTSSPVCVSINWKVVNSILPFIVIYTGIIGTYKRLGQIPWLKQP